MVYTAHKIQDIEIILNTLWDICSEHGELDNIDKVYTLINSSELLLGELRLQIDGLVNKNRTNS